MENICQYFLDSAQKFPNKIAIIHKNQSITFKELEERVKKTSLYFCKKGIKEEDRVLVFVPMSIDLYVNVLALFYIGATAVFLDQFLDRKKLENCAKIANCKGFIGIWKSKLLLLFSKEIRKIPIHLELRRKENQSQNIDINTIYSKNSSLTALITFTTGSTATPKAAKRTHNFLNEQFLALSDVLAENQVKNDKDFKIELTTLPIVLLLNLGIGSTSVIADFKKIEKMKPQKILSQIKTYKIDRMVGSPFFVRTLSEFIENQIATHQITKTDFASLKEIFIGGAPVFQNDIAYFERIFTDSSINIVYGSTEAEPISVVSTKKIRDKIKQNDKIKGLFVGKPYHRTNVKIIDINFDLTNEVIFCKDEQQLNQITKSENEIGEIIVSGSHVLEEYFFDEKDTESFEQSNQILLRNKIFIDGICWHRTGDSGFLDKENNIFLTGRCNSLIYRPKDQIYSPFYYENILSQIDEIEIGTLILKDNKLTFIIEMIKEYKNDEDMKNLLIEMLRISFKEIEQIVFIKQMPKDKRHYSKIDYSKLLTL